FGERDDSTEWRFFYSALFLVWRVWMNSPFGAPRLRAPTQSQWGPSPRRANLVPTRSVQFLIWTSVQAYRRRVLCASPLNPICAAALATAPGRGLINAQPQPDRCKQDEGKVVGSKFVVGHPTTLLDPIEEPSDPAGAHAPVVKTNGPGRSEGDER